MNFEYTPKDFKDDFIELQRQIYFSSNAIKYLKRCTSPLLCIILFFYTMAIMGVRFIKFFDKLIIVGLFFAVFVAAILLTHKKTAKKMGAGVSKLIDLNKTVSITFQDNLMVKENEFSRIKIPFDDIDKINISKRGIDIYTKDNMLELFIPQAVVKERTKEFLELFKDYDIKVNRHNYSYMRDTIKLLFITFLAVAAGVFVAYFRMKYKIAF